MKIKKKRILQRTPKRGSEETRHRLELKAERIRTSRYHRLWGERKKRNGERGIVFTFFDGGGGGAEEI